MSEIKVKKILMLYNCTIVETTIPLQSMSAKCMHEISNFGISDLKCITLILDNIWPCLCWLLVTMQPKGHATHNDGFFNVAKIASERASSTISLTISLHVAGPLMREYMFIYLPWIKMEKRPSRLIIVYLK